MAESDVSLTFDNKMFLKGLEGISKKLESLVGSTEKTTEKISKGVSISAMSFLKINAALSVAKMGISRLMSNIPEIGQTFKIAGDIITRNFLWPLRQQLMPYLQKFLNWVRDHRAMFVKWGGVLTSVFNLVVVGIKAAINILKPFYDAAMKFFKGLFGSTAESIDKMLNIVTFKIAAVMVYLEAVLRPVMENLANIMLRIAESIISFAEGFGNASKDIQYTIPLLQELMKTLKELSDVLFGAGEGWKALGYIIGNIVIPFANGLLLILVGIVKTLKLATAMGSGIVALLSGDKKGMRAASTAITGEDPEEVDKKIAARHADLDLQEKFREKLAAKAQQQKIDNSRNVNVSSLVINADSKAGGEAAADGFYYKIKDHVTISQSAKGN